jgi:hypothetical protein
MFLQAPLTFRSLVSSTIGDDDGTDIWDSSSARWLKLPKTTAPVSSSCNVRWKFPLVTAASTIWVIGAPDEVWEILSRN